MSGSGRVFILDDDKIFLEMYEDLLESRGYDVFATDNAYKFLMYGRELSPDVIFLDINMPEISGWEVLEHLEKDKQLQEVPVVMLTVAPDTALGAIRGAAHFLYKPLVMEEMSEILQSYCEGGKKHDILLLEDYEPLFYDLVKSIKNKKQSCFCTHNIRAAKKYLQKNNPRKIAVRYTPERFAEAEEELHRDDLLRIDSGADLERLLGEA